MVPPPSQYGGFRIASRRTFPTSTADQPDVCPNRAIHSPITSGWTGEETGLMPCRMEFEEAASALGARLADGDDDFAAAGAVHLAR